MSRQSILLVAVTPEHSCRTIPCQGVSRGSFQIPVRAPLPGGLPRRFSRAERRRHVLFKGVVAEISGPTIWGWRTRVPSGR